MCLYRDIAWSIWTRERERTACLPIKQLSSCEMYRLQKKMPYENVPLLIQLSYVPVAISSLYKLSIKLPNTYN